MDCSFDNEFIPSSDEDPFHNSDNSNSEDSLCEPSDEEVPPKKNFDFYALRSKRDPITSVDKSTPKCRLENKEDILNWKTNSEKKIYKRKPDYCNFCEADVLNFARHIKRNRPVELEVVEILSKEAKSHERKCLIDLLRRNGNYLKNANECFKPVRKSYIPNQHVLPCDTCSIQRSYYIVIKKNVLVVKL